MSEPIPDARELVHDLRNRLSAIISAANAIRKSDFDPEIGEEMVDIIRSNVERANATLGSLLARPASAEAPDRGESRP